MPTPYALLHAASRPFAERTQAAHPLRDSYTPAEREHEIRLTQDAYASTAVSQGRTLEEVAAVHGGCEAVALAGRRAVA